MNQKNSLGLNLCFKEEENPIVLFREWFEEAKKSKLMVQMLLLLVLSIKIAIHQLELFY